MSGRGRKGKRGSGCDHRWVSLAGWEPDADSEDWGIESWTEKKKEVDPFGGRLRRGQLAWDNFVKLGPPCPNLEEPRSTPLPPVDQLEESSTVEDTAKVKPRPKTAGTADHVTGEHAQTPRVMSSGGSRAPYDEMSPACNTKRPGQNKKGQGTNSSVPTPCTAVQIADVPGGGVMVTGGGRPEYYDEGEEEGEAIKAARHYKVDETGGKSHDQEQSRKPHLQYSRSNISLQLARSCLLADNTGSKAHVTVSLGEGVHVSNELEGGTPPSGETVNFRLSREQQHTYSTDGAVQDAKHVTFNDMQTVTANEALVNRSGDDDPEDQQRSHANKNGLINLQLALKAANRAPPSTHTPSKHDTYNPTYRPPTASSRPSSGHPRHIGQIYARDLSEGRSREARLPTATMRMPAADLLPAVESSLQSMMGARYQRVMSQREDRPLYDSVRPLVNGAVAGEDSLMMTQSGTDLLQMHDRHQTYLGPPAFKPFQSRTPLQRARESTQKRLHGQLTFSLGQLEDESHRTRWQSSSGALYKPGVQNSGSMQRSTAELTNRSLEYIGHMDDWYSEHRLDD